MEVFDIYHIQYSGHLEVILIFSLDDVHILFLTPFQIHLYPSLPH